MDLKKTLERAKQDIMKQAKATKDLAVDSAKKVADAMVLDEENIPTKQLERLAEKVKAPAPKAKE